MFVDEVYAVESQEKVGLSREYLRDVCVDDQASRPLCCDFFVETEGQRIKPRHKATRRMTLCGSGLANNALVVLEIKA